MRFAFPIYLLLLLVIPLLAWRYATRKGTAPLVYSDIGRIKRAFGTTGTRRPVAYSIRNSLFAARLIVLSLFILSLARPQAELLTSEVFTEGIDIMLTIDVSNSMNLIDLDLQRKRTRIDVTKEVVKTFIDGRRNDRIGMTVFATDAFLQCPLTVDYGIVKNFLESVQIGIITANSTAVGNAVASSLNRLRYTEAKSKAVILITDGANNAGQIDPLTAAEMAKALGVKIYTIGVGGHDTPYIIQNHPLLGSQLTPVSGAEKVDEDSLRKIAQITEGRYFRAADTSQFKSIFDEIDSLEKTRIVSEGNRRFQELFTFLLFPALFLLAIETFLSNTRFRKLP